MPLSDKIISLIIYIVLGVFVYAGIFNRGFLLDLPNAQRLEKLLGNRVRLRIAFILSGIFLAAMLTRKILTIW